MVTENQGTFTADERAAMKERAKEAKAAARNASAAEKAAEAARGVLDKIAEMPPDDRRIAETVHSIVVAAAPQLAPKLWYGMPAYALEGEVVLFVQTAAKFKTRYATIGFSDKARLDDGAMWPTAYAITEITADVEERIAQLVRRAAG